MAILCLAHWFCCWDRRRMVWICTGWLFHLLLVDIFPWSVHHWPIFVVNFLYFPLLLLALMFAHSSVIRSKCWAVKYEGFIFFLDLITILTTHWQIVVTWNTFRFASIWLIFFVDFLENRRIILVRVFLQLLAQVLMVPPFITVAQKRPTDRLLKKNCFCWTVVHSFVMELLMSPEPFILAHQRHMRKSVLHGWSKDTYHWLRHVFRV